MIIQFNESASKNEIEEVKKMLSSSGYSSREVITQESAYLVSIGSKEIDIRQIGNMKAVRDIHRVEDDQKLVSNRWKVGPTRIDLGEGVVVGCDDLSIIAGPCSIEDEDQIRETAVFLKANNISLMRGGVFKPRSSPYSYRGAGIDGLKSFYRICKEEGLKVVTEVMDHKQIEKMYEYVDIFQVGTRNSQNFTLLDALGDVDKPVLLKRGLSGTLDELLSSAEYIFSGGNEKIILCERGIRTFEKSYRNTLDINAIPVLKRRTHLPVIIDPSHGTGIRKIVQDMALAGIMAGADGVIVEIHKVPEMAASDGAQTIDFNEASHLFSNLRKTYSFRSQL